MELTDKGFLYMVAAYFAVWFLLFVYLGTIEAKASRLEKDLALLEEAVKRKRRSKTGRTKRKSKE